MKYFIGYLIKGEAKQYQINLINELSKNFRINNLNKTIMPHLTLKYFAQDIDKKKLIELEKIISEFTKKVRKFNFSLTSFENFDKEVIFMKTSGKGLDRLYSKFFNFLDSIKWIEWLKFEREKHKFHATIAIVKDDAKFIKIQKYLSNLEPKYPLSFDNLAILKKLKNKWIVHKEFKIK